MLYNEDKYYVLGYYSIFDKITTFRVDRMGVPDILDETGKTIWGRETREVPNTELKALVESYKDKSKGSVLSDLSEKKGTVAAATPSEKPARKQEAAR